MSKRRSIFKTFTWRGIASTDTFIIVLVVTHFHNDSITVAMWITSVEIINKIILYYLHERIWAFITRKGWIK